MRTKFAAKSSRASTASTLYLPIRAYWCVILTRLQSSGLHWIVIHVDKNGRGEYFDSFGRAPNKHFESYMNKHCTIWTFNKKQLQSIISSFCGYYCCMFCMLSCRRVDMTKIINMFTTDTGFNDCIAHSFVCNKTY